jgi:hypothetical protein
MKRRLNVQRKFTSLIVIVKKKILRAFLLIIWLSFLCLYLILKMKELVDPVDPRLTYPTREDYTKLTRDIVKKAVMSHFSPNNLVFFF